MQGRDYSLQISGIIGEKKGCQTAMSTMHTLNYISYLYLLFRAIEVGVKPFTLTGDVEMANLKI